MGKKQWLAGLVVFVMSIVLICPCPVQAGYWDNYNQALANLQNGNYQTAIAQFQAALPTFKQIGNNYNLAIIYDKLGTCYAALGDYDNAVDSFHAEAHYFTVLNQDQDIIIANRKAQFFQAEVKLFNQVGSDTIGTQYTHGAEYEPDLGAYIGAYAENDQKAWKNSLYFDGFPALTGKKHAAYLLYMTYGLPFDHYMSHFNLARDENVAMEIALQPMGGLSQVQDDEYLRQFARDAAASKMAIFLRFANEMNDSSAPWFGDPELYKEKFRLIARVFHEEASNVVMVWAPNYFPPNTIQSYYPGDDYVDWVGISLYKEYRPELDPLNQNIDRENDLDNLTNIYNLYAERKPIIITESGITYTDQKTGADITSWAAYQMRQFYADLPMLYPRVKAVFWFDSYNSYPIRSYCLSENPAILNTYKDCISSPYYLTQIGQKSPTYFANVEQTGLSPRVQTVSTYIKSPNPIVKQVIFKIGGQVIASTSQIPWTFSFNFKPYAGQTITINVTGNGNNGEVLIQKNVTCQVGNTNVSLDGKNLDLSGPAITVNDRAFLPVRSLVEGAGGTINWDAVSQSFTVQKGSDRLRLTIGSSTAYKNGEAVILDTAPFIDHNYSYLPLRFICEQILGQQVYWDPDSLTVQLKKS